MAIAKLYDYQRKAVNDLHNGSILCGGVGSGKSRTALAYYYMVNGKDPEKNDILNNPCDLYIITTARKRDELEWEKELAVYLMSTVPEHNKYNNKVVVDSWNNIKKYIGIENAFFIFDEQRVVGTGAWVRSFLKITKKNKWILLSATPGDTWTDYAPVFVANGFFQNITDFKRQHVIYTYNAKYHFNKIDGYMDVGRLIRLRNRILVKMDYERPTQIHHIDIWCNYDPFEYRQQFRGKLVNGQLIRWNNTKDKPIENASELCYELRKIVNTDPDRISKLMDIFNKKKRVIVFYNYDYELDILKDLDYGDHVEVAEWNGHKHQPVPDSGKWVYLVQYNAGAEGWNCIKTDTMIFFSQNYSYKSMTQASGRIDRLNTPFKDLYFYHLKSRAGIDLAIAKALSSKKKFNESNFIGKF